jgi:predicted nucleic acid-binding protein
VGVPRRPDRRQPPGARSVVLDSEALSAITWPAGGSKSTRRAQAVLEAVVRLGGRAIIPAPVLAEVARGPARRAAVGRVLRRMPVVAADRAIAERAGELLEINKLDSCHAVDAFVAATAIGSGYSLVLTGDPDDLRRLTSGAPGVAIQALP